MATSYLAATVDAGTGAAFTLTSGASREFFCDPPLLANEKLYLEIQDSDTEFQPVGILANAQEPVGTVNATGEGSSTFRVSKSPTSGSKRIDYN